MAEVMNLAIAVLTVILAWALFLIGAPLYFYGPLAVLGAIWMACYLAPLGTEESETTEEERAVADWSKERWL